MEHTPEIINGNRILQAKGKFGEQAKVTATFRDQCRVMINLHPGVRANEFISQRMTLEGIQWQSGRANKIYKELKTVIDLANGEANANLPGIQPGFLQRFFYQGADWFNRQNLEALSSFLFGRGFVEQVKRQNIWKMPDLGDRRLILWGNEACIACLQEIRSLLGSVNLSRVEVILQEDDPKMWAGRLNRTVLGEELYLQVINSVCLRSMRWIENVVDAHRNRSGLMDRVIFVYLFEEDTEPEFDLLTLKGRYELCNYWIEQYEGLIPAGSAKPPANEGYGKYREAARDQFRTHVDEVLTGILPALDQLVRSPFFIHAGRVQKDPTVLTRRILQLIHDDPVR